MKNILYAAKEEAKQTLLNDWLSQAKELKEIAKRIRPVGQDGKSGFEKLPRLDLREMGGSEDNPVIMLCKALTPIRNVQTENMERPIPVVDVEVIGCDATNMTAYSRDINKQPVEAPAVWPMKVSIWANTTVLQRELIAYANGKIGEDGVVLDVGRDITGEQFVIASYGTVKHKKNKRIDIYIFKVFKP